MQVDTTRLPPTPPVTAPAPVRGEPEFNWQPGQVLRATVVSILADGRINLAIEGRAEPIEVQGPAPLVAGQQIRLMVELSGNSLALRLLSDEPRTEQSAFAAALRAALPRQGPLQPLLERLASWVRSGLLPELPDPPAGAPAQPAARGAAADQILKQLLAAPPGAQPQATAPAPAAALPRELAAAVRGLLAQLATPEELATPEGLRRALNNAGLFFESKLALGAGGPALANDLKSALLKLVALLRLPAPGVSAAGTAPGPALPHRPGASGAGPAEALPLPPELEQEAQQLLREAEGALARVKVHQLQSVPVGERQDPAFVTEIPLRHGERPEVLELKIEKEERRGNGEEPVWSVRLGYLDPTFGAIAMVVSLTGRHKVGTTFWAEEQRTAALFRDQLPLLEQRLTTAGFEIGALNAHQGRPPAPDRGYRERESLLNVRA